MPPDAGKTASTEQKEGRADMAAGPVKPALRTAFLLWIRTQILDEH